MKINIIGLSNSLVLAHGLGPGMTVANSKICRVSVRCNNWRFIDVDAIDVAVIDAVVIDV